jgi:excinuclease ABC subunit C
MAVEDLKEQIARLPEQPGVYLWTNAAGQTLYVGKARSLRDRVRSYLGAWGLSPRHDALLSEIASLEVIVTDSVMEALALENNLIKQRTPRYNILLRDDKNYPYLRLTTSEPFPRVLVARSVEEGSGDFYAGPFLPAKLARRAMTLSHKVFGIRSCNEVIPGCCSKAAPTSWPGACATGWPRRPSPNVSRRPRSIGTPCARCRRWRSASRRWRLPASWSGTCSA